MTIPFTNKNLFPSSSSILQIGFEFRGMPKFITLPPIVCGKKRGEIVSWSYDMSVDNSKTQLYKCRELRYEMRGLYTEVAKVLGPQLL